MKRYPALGCFTLQIYKFLRNKPSNVNTFYFECNFEHALKISFTT